MLKSNDVNGSLQSSDMSGGQEDYMPAIRDMWAYTCPERSLPQSAERVGVQYLFLQFPADSVNIESIKIC